MPRELGGGRVGRRSRALATSPPSVILAMAACAALVLAMPRRTVATRELEELFYIFDGAHRVLWGHAPGRDFLTSLGPLPYYLTALGERLAGWGGAMPFAMALTILVVAPVLAHVLTTRLNSLSALLLAGFLLVILAAPINLGERITALSFAHFHNRIGWVATALLLVMYLSPKAQVPHMQDTACAALLAIIMICTRATYGAVAVIFLIFMLTDSRQRLWAAWSLAATVVAMLGVELLWGGSAGYLRATLMDLDADGVLRGTWGQVTDHAFTNFADYVLLALIAGLSLWVQPRMRDAAFFLFCAIMGFWLINHNTQHWGILSLHAGAVVAVERIVRNSGGPTKSPVVVFANPPGARLLFTVMVLPTIVHYSIALALHAGAAASGAGRPLATAGMEQVRLVNLWTEGGFGHESRYLEIVDDGLAALTGLSPGPERLVVIGGPDPFSPALDLEPALGVMPDLRRLAKLGATHRLRPEEILADAEVVMERVSGSGAGSAGEVLLPVVEKGFSLAVETEHWRVHRRDPIQSVVE